VTDVPGGHGAEAASRRSDPLPRDELKRRASAGVLIVGTRGAAIASVGLVGQVLLARLLVPADFGAVAVGLATVAFVNLLADGGLGAALIRRDEAPTRRELQALTALQVTETVVIAAVVIAVAPALGHVGWVTALIVCSTPLLAMQIPGRIVLERALAYRRLAAVEILQVLVFNVWALAWVLSGAGVWGLATAPLARSAVGAVAMAWASPVGIPLPRFSWRRIRALLGFGLRFQAVTALWLVREQGLNLLVAALSGVTTLGLVSIARRVLEVPHLLFGALWRVSFPTMSELVARDERVSPLVERAVGITAVVAGGTLAGLAAAAPGLVPAVFGEPWRSAATILPAACLGLALAGPVSVAGQGYLYAVGDAATVLRAGVAQTAALFAVTASLLPWLGITAVGLGWLAAHLVESVLLGRATARRSGGRLLRPLLGPVAAATVAGGAGWFVTTSLPGDLGPALLGAASAGLLFLALTWVVDRHLLGESARFVVAAVHAARATRRTAPPTGPSTETARPTHG
jgi:O-antigen/teichoic acid export membrane protein